MRVRDIDFGFNRTFMELKRHIINIIRVSLFGFNRTFMELKQVEGVSTTEDRSALIGPSWN